MGFDQDQTRSAVPAPATGTDDKTRPIVSLDYVFDDPSEGEPGQDRLRVHGIWEIAMLLALAVTGFLLFRENASVFSGAPWRAQLLSAAVLGLLASASALSLRAAAPNLAVGAVAVAAGLYFGANSNGGLLGPLLIVIGLSALVGLVQAAIIVLPHVPAWAASIGVAMALFAWIRQQGAVTLTGGYDPAPHAYFWFGGFAILSVGVSVIFIRPSLRRFLGRFRPVADPAARRGRTAAGVVIAVTLVATILAGVAGVLLVSARREVVPGDASDLTALALGAALLGGTSVYGRRGGIFGTVLAVSLLSVIDKYGEEVDRAWPVALLAAVAIGVGLLVTRLVEQFGRPLPPRAEADEDESWFPRLHSSSPEAPSSWTGGANSTAGPIWSADEAWGVGDRS